MTVGPTSIWVDLVGRLAERWLDGRSLIGHFSFSVCFASCPRISAVHYNGYLEYSEEPFDSSRLRDEIHMFRLGKGQLVICMRAKLPDGRLGAMGGVNCQVVGTQFYCGE